MKTLTLEMEREVYSALESYRKHINKNTGSDLTRSEAAVALLKLSLKENGRLGDN